MNLRRILGTPSAILGLFLALCILESHGETQEDGVQLSGVVLGEQATAAEELLSNATNSARSKRNAANSSNSVEGLLASCQLTNLLLYQALQQQRQAAAQTNPLLALATSNLQGLGSSLALNSLPIANGVNPAGAGIAGGLLNPFPAAINQNLIFPAAPTLQTYTTTSTYVTKMTTTAVITVPLLFGNKPFSTTITRTKTYDVTTSEVKTLTSTIQPTIVNTASAISPTSVSGAALSAVKGTAAALDKAEYEEYEEDVQYHNDVQEDRRGSGGSGKKSSKYTTQDTAENVRVTESVPAKSSKSRGGNVASTTQKNRKIFTRQPTTTSTPTTTRSKHQKEDSSNRGSAHSKRYQSQPVEEDYYSPSYGSTSSRGSQTYKSNGKTNDKGTGSDSQFYQRQYGTIQDDDVPVDEDPAAAQYPDDYSYYTRRLKRGEQFEDEDEDHESTKLDREYLLEPSTDGDYSGNYHKYEKCPPIPANAAGTTVTVTATETKTITKFLKGQTASATASVHNNYYGNGGFTSSAPVAAASGSRTFVPSNSGSGRSRGSFKSRNQNQDSDAAATSSASSSDSRRSFSKSTTSTTTTERSSSPAGDRRAQILRRGKARYTPANQDYDPRG